MTYTNGRDRSRDAERRAADALREKNARADDARLRENELEIARMEAKIEALHERALADDALREAVRVALWAKVPGAVSGSYINGEAVLSVPDGLPEGMTEGGLNAAILDGLGRDYAD